MSQVWIFAAKQELLKMPMAKTTQSFSDSAPKNNPKIAIAVFIENAGFGAEYAAPIASLMIEKYLNKVISPERKYLEERMFKSTLNPTPESLLANID